MASRSWPPPAGFGDAEFGAVHDRELQEPKRLRVIVRDVVLELFSIPGHRIGLIDQLDCVIVEIRALFVDRNLGLDEDMTLTLPEPYLYFAARPVISKDGFEQLVEERRQQGCMTLGSSSFALAYRARKLAS